MDKDMLKPFTIFALAIVGAYTAYQALVSFWLRTTERSIMTNFKIYNDGGCKPKGKPVAICRNDWIARRSPRHEKEKSEEETTNA